MEIIFPAPQFLLWVVLGVFAISVPAVFLKKGKWLIKIISIALITIICGVLLFFFYRETKLAVTDEGIYSNNYGEFTIKWGEIDKLFVINDLKNSEYKPTIRTNGYASGETGFGWFSLKNGKSARVVLQTRGKCLVVLAGGRTFLFAPKNFDAFIRAIGKYIDIPAYEEDRDD
jgi:energy-coupling factor transporter transmembrane protein EcfT